MDVFIGQLVGFAIIVFLFWKYVLPPVRRVVRNQQDTVERQVAESEAAKKRLAEAQQAHEKAVSEAKVEAEQLHKDALEDAKAIEDDLRKAADAEVKRISEHGSAQVAMTRANLLRGLRADLGLTAVDGAGALVRSHLAEPDNQSASVDQVIEELSSMADGGQVDGTVPGSAELVGTHSMRAASREAARVVATEFDSAAADLDGSALSATADDLAKVIDFLNDNPVLRKRICEDEDNPAGKKALVHALFDGKVNAATVDVVAVAAAQRWSSSADFMAGLRRQNSLVVLTAAERDGVIEQVEDELFRAGRLLDGNPQLGSLLADYTRSADKRVELLKSLIGSQVHTYTWLLLSHTIRTLHGQPAEAAVDQLAQLAAARRGESVAHVVTAAPLTDAQQGRLTEVLGTIYHRSMSVQTEIDPDILGGLRVRVGDEVIEADIATRLAKATESLPR